MRPLWISSKISLLIDLVYLSVFNRWFMRLAITDRAKGPFGFTNREEAKDAIVAIKSGDWPEVNALAHHLKKQGRQ